ncbi:glycosyltransferase [Polaromonas sp. P2-4]|nr:glycosyltransferase [Polaromonas sp. P2-4]
MLAARLLWDKGIAEYIEAARQLRAQGLPKSLIEAAARALPLVTTDAPGCREVVRHEVDGLIVPVKDAHALSSAIVP